MKYAKKKYTFDKEKIANAETYTCAYCGKQYKGVKSFSMHLLKAHGIQSDEDCKAYYNAYMKKPGEGICEMCGKPTPQYRWGYATLCSEECARKRGLEKMQTMDRERYFKILAPRLATGFAPEVTDRDLDSDLAWLRKTHGNLDAQGGCNHFVQRYQYKQFYIVERRNFYGDRNCLNKVCRYLEKYHGCDIAKTKTTTIYRAFKYCYRTLPRNRYSSPLWSKYFAEKYGVRVVAEPFGGWGQTTLGLWDAGCHLYYNDLSPSIVDGVREIADYAGITDIRITNRNAKDFRIPDDCDGVFFYPPNGEYEGYECGRYRKYGEYSELIRKSIRNVLDSNARYLCVITRDWCIELYDEIQDCLVEKGQINEPNRGTANSYNLIYMYVYDLSKHKYSE